MDRRERRHSETREEILRAARALVVEKGAGDLSLREVAARTQFTPPALYRYFPGGKEEVLRAIASECLEQLGAHLRRVPDGLPADERLIELGLVYLEFGREHPEELGLIFDSIAALESLDVADPDESVFAPTSLFGIVDRAIRDGVESAGLKAQSEDDIVLMWHGAWAFLHGIVAVERVHPHHHDLFRARARDLLRAYLNGLMTDWAGGVASGRPSREDDCDARGHAR